MFKDFYHSFYYTSLILSVLVSIVLIKRVSGLFQWLAALIILTLISESIAKYLAYIQRTNNNAVYHFFTLVEYFFYAQVYKCLLAEKKWSRLINFSVAFLFAAELGNVLFLQRLNTSNTNTIILESLLLTFLALSWFNKARQSSSAGDIFRDGVFWFNSAVLYYYSFSVLIWGFHSLKVYRMENPPLVIYDVILLISGLLYLVYAAALVLNYSFRKSML